MTLGAAAFVAAGVMNEDVTIHKTYKNGLAVEQGQQSTAKAAVTLPAGALSGADFAGATLRVAYCGQLEENGEVFLGAETPSTIEPTLADSTCDANDSTNEATADVVLSTTLALYPKYMYCTANGTLGAGETLTAQLRDDTANVTGVTCSMAEAETTCEVATPSASAVAASSTSAVEANEASNNSDDDLKCIVLYAVE